MWHVIKKILSTLLTSVISVILFVVASASVQNPKGDCADNFEEWKKQASWRADGGTVRTKEIIVENADGKQIVRIYANGDEGMMTVETTRGPKTASLSSLARRFGE